MVAADRLGWGPASAYQLFGECTTRKEQASMELETLRLLVIVSEQASFTRAAAKTGLTQSALSRHVQRLEGIRHPAALP